jgi:hypothetical protein
VLWFGGVSNCNNFESKNWFERDNI